MSDDNYNIKTEKGEEFAGDTKELPNILLSKSDETKLLKQAKAEFKLAQDIDSSKKEIWQQRLKLYNNQRKRPEAVGDNLMFTIIQTLLASLYSDQLLVEFNGVEEGDDEVAESLNYTAENDAKDMHKAELDYFWTWNTLFFSKGIVKYCGFDHDKKLPITTLVDPFGFYRDPKAWSIHGIGTNGDHACRFLGHEIELTRLELQDSEYYAADTVKKLIADRSDPSSDQQQGNQAKNLAAGINDATAEGDELADNISYQLIEWSTHFKGKKCVIVADMNFKFLVRYVEVPFKFFPYVERVLFPQSHQFWPTSVPDLTEDKQRKRAMVQNIAIQSMEVGLRGVRLFDRTKVNSKDMTAQTNGLIPVKGDVTGKVQELASANPNLAVLDYIMDTLDSAAQRSTSTPEMQQGALASQARTLGELNLVAAKVDTRYSLAAAIFMWSEMEFWYIWYKHYVEYYGDFDKKVIRIRGAFGNEYRLVSKEDLIAGGSIDVTVKSKKISTAENTAKLNRYANFLKIMMVDPNTNRRYAMKFLGKLSGLDSDEIARLMPQTPDELIAEDENEVLSEDEIVKVKPEDNHVVHMEIHQKAKTTNAAIAHIRTHKEAIRLQKEQPNLFPGMDQGVQPQEKSPQTGTEPDLLKVLSPGARGQNNITPENYAG